MSRNECDEREHFLDTPKPSFGTGFDRSNAPLPSWLPLALTFLQGQYDDERGCLMSRQWLG